MKKLNKATTIVVSIVILVVMALGFLLSYIPMTFGAKTYLSLAGSINVSSDLMGGMYGEYDITTENPTAKTLVSSMDKIKTVFEGYGYKNVNVYTYGSKLRVEVSYPRGSKSYSDVYSELSIVSGGAFFLSSSNDAAATDAVVVDGNECVDKVEVYTNDSVKYISIKFNEKGQELYEQLCSATSSIYMHLGDYSQQITASNVTDFTAFTLSDNDYANLISLEQRVIIGCMGIEINSKTAVIETMSASLIPGASSPEEKGFSLGTLSIIFFSLFAGVVVLLLALFAAKFGFFAVLVLLSMLFNSYIFLILLNLMPSIEIGLSGVISLTLGTALIYTYTFIYASRVKHEYNLGKSFNAALEAGFKKTFPTTLISNIALLVSSLIIFAFSFGELTSAVIIFAICMGLSLLTNALIIPLFVRVAISYKKLDTKVFMLKKRAIGFEEAEEEGK